MGLSPNIPSYLVSFSRDFLLVSLLDRQVYSAHGEAIVPFVGYSIFRSRGFIHMLHPGHSAMGCTVGSTSGSAVEREGDAS